MEVNVRGIAQAKDSYIIVLVIIFFTRETRHYLVVVLSEIPLCEISKKSNTEIIAEGIREVEDLERDRKKGRKVR